jgi:acyl carrier protein
MKDIKEVVVSSLKQVAEEQGLELAEELQDETVLLESGLDSLAFAILVAELESSLGYDPFTMMESPVYPRTLAEFVAVYKRFEQHRVA